MTLTSRRADAGRTPALPPAPPGSVIPMAEPGQLSPQQRRVPAADRERRSAGMPHPETGAEGPCTTASAPVRERALQAPSPALAVGTPDEGTADPRLRRGRPKTSAGEGRRRAAGASLADIQAAAMSEDELEEQVRDACTKLGILRFHVRVSKGTTAGLPDDILIGPRGILWRELKNQTRKPTPAQVKTGAALTAIGQDFALWRPEDWFSGRIVSELRTIAHTPGVLRMFPPDGAA